MRKAGRLASECLQMLCEAARPGVSTKELDDLAVQFCKKHGAKAATLNYRGYPASICTSINEVICHGIPSSKEILVAGDIIGIDVTLIVEGFFGDNCATVPVGAVSEEAALLLQRTLEALRRGVEAVKPHANLNQVGRAIEAYAAPFGYGVVRDFVGHGIGRQFHEEPQVLHYADRLPGPRLRPGMTFTIEPMINAGLPGSVTKEDGWRAVTVDGRLSAQFEHTIAVTDLGVEILTVQNETGAWEPPGRAVLPVVGEPTV